MSTEAIAALDQAATDMRKGYPGHGHSIEYVNGWEDAAAFAERHASGGVPATGLASTEAAQDGSAVPTGTTDGPGGTQGRFRIYAAPLTRNGHVLGITHDGRPDRWWTEVEDFTALAELNQRAGEHAEVCR
jgi:hypothetical protein